MTILQIDSTVRDYWHYGHQPVLGFTKHDPKAAFTGRTLMGSPIQAQYLYGFFRSPDGKAYHAPIRHFHNDVAVSLFMYSTRGLNQGEDFQYVRDSAKAHRGIVEVGAQDNMWGWWRPEANSRYFFLSDETSAIWHEHEMMDVKGEVRGNCMQFSITDERFPLVYTSRCFKVSEGDCMGDKVAGYYFHDTVHMGLGQGWTLGRYMRELEESWVAFVTEFEDGNVEMGHLITGRKNFSLAIIQGTDRPPLFATNIKAEIELDSRGFAEQVRYILDRDEVWIWENINGARLPRSPLPEGPSWIEGYVHRKGDDRPWIHSDAWMETYNHRIIGNTK